jgi:CelD/BcsL family acetyltransferase involved in cellulose biosynthesis
MALSVRRQDLESLRSEWQELLSRTPEPHVFHRPIWQELWLEHFGDGREPLFLAARDGEHLVGVAPLMRDGPRLALVGDHEICDYMDFVVEPGREKEFFAAIFHSLGEEPWEEIDLRGLAAYSPALTALATATNGLGWRVERELEAVAPHVELPASWEEYLAGLDRKDRHELRRKMRRLRQSGARVELRDLRSPQEVAAGMEDFLRLHTASRSDKAEFMSPQMQRFFRAMSVALAKEGLIRLFMMDLDGRPAASVLCFDCCQQLHLYNSGFDPELSSLSVGLLSKVLCLEVALKEGKGCLDFLRGSEPYKYDLGGHDLPIYRCRVRRG